jgi:hypothetical protein
MPEVATHPSVARPASPRSRAVISPMRTRAAAPSLIPEELPTVTVPPAWKAARTLYRLSIVVAGRGCSSTVVVTGSFSFTRNGVIYSENAARHCDSRPPLALQGKLILLVPGHSVFRYLAATFSAVTPICLPLNRSVRIATVPSIRVRSRSRALSRASKSRNGILDIDSSPPAKMTSASVPLQLLCGGPDSLQAAVAQPVHGEGRCAVRP